MAKKEAKSTEEVVEVPGLVEDLGAEGERVILASPPLFNHKEGEPRFILAHSSELVSNLNVPANSIFAAVDTNERYRMDPHGNWIKIETGELD